MIVIKENYTDDDKEIILKTFINKGYKLPLKDTDSIEKSIEIRYTYNESSFKIVAQHKIFLSDVFIRPLYNPRVVLSAHYEILRPEGSKIGLKSKEAVKTIKDIVKRYEKIVTKHSRKMPKYQGTGIGFGDCYIGTALPITVKDIEKTILVANSFFADCKREFSRGGKGHKKL